MGYKTEAAQFVAKKCKDHHQAWEMILIFFFGSLRELIVLYVRSRKRNGNNELSVEDFLSFTSEMKEKPNFIYLCNQVINYAFAIINFRMALRRNNLKFAHSAVSDIFYGRVHPFYQLIEVHFMAQMFCLHDDVKPLFENYYHQSFR